MVNVVSVYVIDFVVLAFLTDNVTYILGNMHQKASACTPCSIGYGNDVLRSITWTS